MKLNGLYIKIILTVIAVCLVILVIQTGLTAFSVPADAATKKMYPPIEVFSIGNIPAEDIKQVITLGDQHTFILQLNKEIRVYRVDYVRAR